MPPPSILKIEIVNSVPFLATQDSRQQSHQTRHARQAGSGGWLGKESAMLSAKIAGMGRINYDSARAIHNVNATIKNDLHLR